MTSNRHVRYLLGIVLGGLAGFSFTISVFPYALGLRDARNVHLVLHAVNSMGPWLALVWAVGGWSVARLAARGGTPWMGGVTLGLVGGASGIALAVLRIGAATWPIGMGLLAGVVYGFAGGWILGRVTAAPDQSVRKEKP